MKWKAMNKKAQPSFTTIYNYSDYPHPYKVPNTYFSFPFSVCQILVIMLVMAR